MMDNIFAIEAPKLVELGYAVFPCRDPRNDSEPPGKRGKRPLNVIGDNKGVKGASTDMAQIAAWADEFPNANIGLACSNCLVIDVDNKDGKAGNADIAKISSVLGTLPLTPFAKTGSNGFHMFFAKPDIEIIAQSCVKWNGEKTGLDIRVGNAYVIAPPSLHENGKRYSWGRPLVPPCELPPLPQNWIDEFLPKREKCQYSVLNSPPVPTGSNAIDQCQKYLDTIDPLHQGSRNNGIFRPACIIFWDFGLSQTEGLPLLQYFNTTKVHPPLSEYEINRAMKRVFERDHKDLRGWRQQQQSNLPKFPDVDISSLVPTSPPPQNVQVITEPKVMKLPEPLPEKLLYVPGFVDKVTQFSMRGSAQPNLPIATLGALACQSVLVSRKVKAISRTRPSLYLLALASTGTGKDYPRSVNQYILTRCGLEAHIKDKVASGEGLEDEIITKQVLLLQIDEVNFTIANMAKGEQRFNSLEEGLLTLYSLAKSQLTGRIKANNTRNYVPPQTVYEPALVLFGTATPERFCRALTIDQIEGGLPGRCIVIEGVNRGYTMHEIELTEMPDDILEIAQHWANFQPINPETGKPGNINGLQGPPFLHHVGASSEAEDKLVSFRKHCDEEAIRLSKNNRIAAALWTRVYESALRLSLVYACSKNHDNPIIDLDAATWASEFMLRSNEGKIMLVERNVADNPFHAICLRVVNIIYKNGGRITHSRLIKNANLSSKTVKEAIDTLIEAERIKIEFAETSGRPRLEYVLLED